MLLQVTRTDVARMLRGDALNLGLGVLLLAVGITALIAYARPLRRREPPLPWFGLFTLLYGFRLLARTETFPLFFSLPRLFWLYVGSTITYLVPVPAVLLVRAVFPRWRRPLGWVAAFLATFAVSAIAADTVLRRPYSAQTPNNVFAIAFMIVSLLVLFRPGSASTGDARTLRAGLVAFVATAVVDNLRGLGALSWPTFDLEPLGATVLIACLATIAARQALESRGRLLALDKELSIARRIQSSILPGAMPSVEGLAVAARYEPMTAVAGDFYDFLEVGDRRLGILVADVSGHGVPAALIASMVKVAVAAQKPRADRPAAVLAGMNEALIGQLGGQYVTAAYLFLDREAGVMRYSGAGHPPLLRWRASDQRTHEIEENGLPLGLMDVAHYQELEQPLLAGDRFLLYTDGLVEATNAAGDDFSIRGVSAVIAAGVGLPTETLADRILQRTRDWASDSAADDLTLVLVDCV